MMSATTSATTGRRYGLERVCRMWERSRSALYARRARLQRQERGARPARRGPTPALSDAQLLAAIRPRCRFASSTPVNFAQRLHRTQSVLSCGKESKGPSSRLVRSEALYLRDAA